MVERNFKADLKSNLGLVAIIIVVIVIIIIIIIICAPPKKIYCFEKKTVIFLEIFMP
jgi:hypothetical protein